MTLDEIERALSAAGIGESRTEAYILAEHFLKIPKSRLVLMNGEELLSDGLSAAVERRINREPLAYILGSAYFMNEEYEVSPDCLIPRPETEQLVCRAVELLPHGGRFLDLCTGSGCVAVSLLSLRHDASGEALDISDGACRLAERNACRAGVDGRLKIVRADMFSWKPCAHDVSGVSSDGESAGGCADFRESADRSHPTDETARVYDIITANPPYVTAEEMRDLAPELYFEPEIALTDGGDGLSFVRELVRRYTRFVKRGGYLLCEIGSGEGASSLEIAADGGFDTEILKDFSGCDRILSVRV